MNRRPPRLARPLALRLALLSALLSALLLAPLAGAQDYGFQPPADAADPATGAAVRDLAERILPVYAEPDPEAYLATISILQLAAGQFAAGAESRQSLRERRGARLPPPPLDAAIVTDLYARARAIEAQAQVPFAQAFERAWTEQVSPLPDRDVRTVADWLSAPVESARGGLQRAFDQARVRGSVPEADALLIAQRWVEFEAARNLGPLAAGLAAAEERRRYEPVESVVVRTHQGARIHAVVVRPRSGGKIPAVLEFGLPPPGEARARVAATYGFAGVSAYLRNSVGGERGTVEPFAHEAADARVLIDWIAAQPWSDGRVALAGDGFAGYAAWAAARKPPAALKAIATFAPMAIGIDFPMRGGIFDNDALRWLHRYAPERRNAPDDAAWRTQQARWFGSGESYRTFERRFGGSHAMFRLWLGHPSFDRWWRNRLPSAAELGQLAVPVLTLAGPEQAGALYYFEQHMGARADADHMLVLGPWAGSGGEADALRFAWLEHVLRGAARPALLKDRVNLAVAGGAWVHAPSLAQVPTGRLRLNLSKGRLVEGPAAGAAQAAVIDGFVPLQVDLNKARESATVPAFEPGSRAPDLANAIAFSGDALAEPAEIAGRVSGVLDLTINRQDADFVIALYERQASGAHFAIGGPWEFRASYARDRTQRRLLQAGVRQQLPFTLDTLAARRLEAGSQLVVTVGLVKRPDRQTNFGGGDDVSAEVAGDQPGPFRIRLHGGSWIELPLRRSQPEPRP